MIRAARLDPSLYEEVEADRSTTRQAVAVVLLSGVAAGLGGLPNSGAISLAIGLASALSGWIVWAGLTYLIGAKLFPETATHTDFSELLRTIGFAASPGLIRIFGLVPALTEAVFLAAAVWMLVAMVVAVRQALDYQSTSRAVGVCVLGWLVQVTGFLLLLRSQGIDPRILGQMGS